MGLDLGPTIVQKPSDFDDVQLASVNCVGGIEVCGSADELCRPQVTYIASRGIILRQARLKLPMAINQ